MAVMGDADVIFLMKNIPQNLWVSEYFERRKRKHQIKFVKILKSFAEEESIDFDFNIILAKQFSSGFGKQEFSKIKMVFPELSVPCKFGEVSNALTSLESKGEKFFYLFYKRKNEKQAVSLTTLVEELLTLAYAIQAEDKIKEKKRHIK